MGAGSWGRGALSCPVSPGAGEWRPCPAVPAVGPLLPTGSIPVPLSLPHTPFSPTQCPASSPPVMFPARFVPRCLISAPALGFQPCPSSRHCTHLMLRLISALPNYSSCPAAQPHTGCSSSCPAVELRVYIFNSGPEFQAFIQPQPCISVHTSSCPAGQLQLSQLSSIPVAQPQRPHAAGKRCWGFSQLQPPDAVLPCVLLPAHCFQLISLCSMPGSPFSVMTCVFSSCQCIDNG